ncbi:MAG: ankyrin repeat domain-containing protein [Candidatus Rickettsiella isopodorum]|jgi:hypothetical protein|nr:ankyrin repeat domain-containing protein [Gammaproteobacteria bacterium]MCH9755039.1 ankyrin repeat domain-containing protein [Gammaproteobacteria bacterium]MDD4893583.1 ankyrin repeat domain-containing protein [Candidatus Rickettsiella isopodorum]MDD5161742.1 ankyrin repeat domain-containing protein [Candidatus Rickettsiella isopodorum]
MKKKEFRKLNKLLKRAFWQECRLVGNSNTAYRIEFRSRLTVGEFTQFVEDCKLFLSHYEIEIGSIFTITQGKLCKLFTIQIGKLPPTEKLAEKMKELTHTIQLHDTFYQDTALQINLLLDHGANINSKNIAGETVLHAAVRMGYDKIVNLLIKRGASLNIVSNRGETPLKIVDQKKDAVMGRVLIDALLHKDQITGKPDFKTQELNDYWDEQMKLLIVKPIAQLTSIEGAAGEIECRLTDQKIKDIMQFFSDIPILQSPLEDSDEQMRENLLLQL